LYTGRLLWTQCSFSVPNVMAIFSAGSTLRGALCQHEMGALLTPLPSPSLPSPYLPVPSPFPLPLPSCPLEVGPLNTARGFGERCNAPRRIINVRWWWWWWWWCKLSQRSLWRSPSGNRIWCILALKHDNWWHGTNFTNFPENQLTIVYAFFKLHKKTFSLRIFSAHNAKSNTHGCCQQKWRHTTNCNHNVT